MTLSAFGKSLAEEYDTACGEIPEWITEKRSSLKMNIAARVRDQLAKALSDAEKAVNRLKSRDEQKQEALDRVAALKTKMSSMTAGG
jgi:hypothetical protein